MGVHRGPPRVQLRYRHRVLGLAVAANFSQFGARLALSPLVPFILVEFSLTKATAGLLLAGMWVCFALLQYPSGILADRYGERRVVVAAMVATAASSLLLALTRDLVAFGAAVLVLGASAGLYFSVGTSLLTRLFRRRGGALGLHSAGAPLSGVAVPVAMTAIASRYGWQRGFLATAAVAGTTALLVGLLVRPTPPARPTLRLRDEVRPARLRALLGSPSVATSLVLAVVGMYVFQALVSFFPTYLQEYHGLDPATASLLFGLVFVVSAVSLPLQGRLSDRGSRDAVVAAAFATTAVGFAVTLAATGRGLLLAGVVVVGAGLGWGGVIQSRIMDGFPERERGTGFGLVRTLFLVVGSSGSAVTGLLADVAGWATAYGLVVGLLGASSAAIAVGARVHAGRS